MNIFYGTIDFLNSMCYNLYMIENAITVERKKYELRPFEIFCEVIRTAALYARGRAALHLTAEP